MYMSQSASSSPTPRSTSRVMMTGLIGPDLRRDCSSGSSHDDWRKTCLMESWRKNLAYPTDGRVRTVTTFIACRPRSVVLPAPHAVPMAMGGAVAESLGRRDGVLGPGRQAT